MVSLVLKCMFCCLSLEIKYFCSLKFKFKVKYFYLFPLWCRRCSVLDQLFNVRWNIAQSPSQLYLLSFVKVYLWPLLRAESFLKRDIFWSAVHCLVSKMFCHLSLKLKFIFKKLNYFFSLVRCCIFLVYIHFRSTDSFKFESRWINFTME